MGIRKAIQKRVLGAGQKAVEKLLSDEKRALQVAQAVGAVQNGKRALDKRQQELMRALQLAPQADFKQVGKQLASLKRRVRELEEKIDALGAIER